MTELLLVALKVSVGLLILGIGLGSTFADLLYIWLRPGLLLRSAAPDPHEQLGRRTLIHPVVLSLAQMPERIDPFYGAPQSIASVRASALPSASLTT